MQARTVVADAARELAARIEEQQRAGFTATLAVVFASIAHDLDEVRGVFAGKGIDVFGASSAGEIVVDGGVDETIRAQSIVALLLDVQRDSYRLNLIDATDTPSAEAGRAAGRWAAGAFARPALLVVASGLATDGEQVVRGIVNELGADAPVYGGLAGDDVRFQGTFVFTATERSPQGVLVLAFDANEVEITGIASSGWAPVGGERTVTGATGNVVHTIDGEPALDVYREYLGLNEDASIVFPEYPLQLERDGYTVLRAPLMSDPSSRSLVYAGSVPEGATVRFSCAPGAEITEHALADIRTLRERTPNADALLLFSCKGRHMALGPMAEDEVQPIQELWDAPLVGFYTYGEIGKNAVGASDFHNETCVVVTLRER
jgi:hypothetical protein